MAPMIRLNQMIPVLRFTARVELRLRTWIRAQRNREILLSTRMLLTQMNILIMLTPGAYGNGGTGRNLSRKNWDGRAVGGT